MEELQVFKNEEFGQVRTLTIDDEPYFVGKDVAIALGYKDTSDAIKVHVDEDDKGVGEIPTPGGKQKMITINESGLYSLIFGSKLEKAKEFKHWVTSKVLPSIRKTGSYQLKPNIKTTTGKLDFVIKLLSELPNDKYKNRTVNKVLNFIGIENKEKQLKGAKLTGEEIKNILEEFLSKEDVIIKETEYGLALNKEKLYKHFEKYGLKRTETLKTLDEYGLIYHKQDCRTVQIRCGGVNPIRVVIVR